MTRTNPVAHITNAGFNALLKRGTVNHSGNAQYTPLTTATKRLFSAGYNGIDAVARTFGQTVQMPQRLVPKTTGMAVVFNSPYGAVRLHAGYGQSYGRYSPAMAVKAPNSDDIAGEPKIIIVPHQSESYLPAIRQDAAQFSLDSPIRTVQQQKQNGQRRDRREGQQKRKQKFYAPDLFDHMDHQTEPKNVQMVARRSDTHVAQKQYKEELREKEDLHRREDEEEENERLRIQHQEEARRLEEADRKQQEKEERKGVKRHLKNAANDAAAEAKHRRLQEEKKRREDAERQNNEEAEKSRKFEEAEHRRKAEAEYRRKAEEEERRRAAEKEKRLQQIALQRLKDIETQKAEKNLQKEQEQLHRKRKAEEENERLRREAEEKIRISQPGAIKLADDDYQKEIAEENHRSMVYVTNANTNIRSGPVKRRRNRMNQRY